MTGVEVKSIRLSLSLTQQEFATQVGVSITALSKWKNGNSHPNRASVKLIGILIAKEKRKKKYEARRVRGTV